MEVDVELETIQRELNGPMNHHLFLCESGILGRCELCGERYAHDNHKEFFGKNSMDLYHLGEDERIEVIASHVLQGQVVAVMLEFGIGKVERYIEKLAERHPNVRLVDRLYQANGGHPIELVRFGPKLNA